MKNMISRSDFRFRPLLLVLPPAHLQKARYSKMKHGIYVCTTLSAFNENGVFGRVEGVPAKPHKISVDETAWADVSVFT